MQALQSGSEHGSKPCTELTTFFKHSTIRPILNGPSNALKANADSAGPLKDRGPGFDALTAKPNPAGPVSEPGTADL